MKLTAIIDNLRFRNYQHITLYKKENRWSGWAFRYNPITLSNIRENISFKNIDFDILIKDKTSDNEKYWFKFYKEEGFYIDFYIPKEKKVYVKNNRVERKYE